MTSKTTTIVVLLTCIVLFISCIKEIPIEPHTQGEINLGSVDMGNDYNHQIFYSLSENEIVKQNLETQWDIAFECRENGWHVILNSSLSGAVYNSNETEFSSVTNISGNENWKYDSPNGNLDSTAFGDYRNGNVYIINRGVCVSQGGASLGYKKVIINCVNSMQYEIRSADINGDLDNTIIITKDTNVNFLAFSLNSNSILDIEPNKTQWDLLFTAYTHVFNSFTPPMPYRVSGVLLNRRNTTVKVDTNNNFENIDYETVNQYEFSSNIDEIGYDWKNYSFSTSMYSVDINKTFIIRNQSGLFFKLRFIDFYNDNGDKGSPKFELQQL